MKLNMHTVTQIRLQEDSKVFWELKPSDIDHVDDKEFPKLPRAGTTGFCRLVCEGLQHLHEKVSLTMSKGYELLLDARREALKSEIADTKEKRMPQMFRNVANINFEHIRLTKEMSRAHRSNPEVVTFMTPDSNIAVTMKKPSNFRDDLCVSIAGGDLSMLEAVADFSQAHGFEETVRRSSSLPKGVYKNKDGASHPYSFRYDGRRYHAKNCKDAETGATQGPQAIERVKKQNGRTKRAKLENGDACDKDISADDAADGSDADGDNNTQADVHHGEASNDAGSSDDAVL